MTEEKILDRVAKLLAIAEHPNTGEHEAEVALGQANRLIAKHAIEEAVLRQAQTIGQRRALERKTISINAGEFTATLTTILCAAAEANRLSVARFYGKVEVFGASEDIGWVETLFSMIQLQFLLKINPKWDESKSADENIYNFKVAGYKWAEIDQLLVAHGGESMENLKKERIARWRAERNGWTILEGDDYYVTVERPSGYFHKMFGAYKRYAKKIGDTAPVTTQNRAVYRQIFGDEFRYTMERRFARMAGEAQEEMDTIPGAAMVMVSQKEESNRLLWDAYPDLDPVNVAARVEAYRASRQQEIDERNAKLDAMTPAQRAKFLDDEERARIRADKAARRGMKFYAFDESARRKGQQAANGMDLTRKGGAAGQAATRGELG